MSFDPKLSQPYSAIRNMYDAGFDNPSVGTYNALSGSIYELKSTHTLPDRMYDSLNRMQENFGQQLGGLERKL